MFARKFVESSFLSPLKDFSLDKQRIEFRRDTLTGRWCRINVARAKRVRQSTSSEHENNDHIELKDFERGCFFCPEKVDKDTPKFQKTVIREGRIKIGETVLFPNLFPFAYYHGIAIVTTKHYVGLEEFTKRQLRDTLTAGITFLKKVCKMDSKIRHTTMLWNFLPPSGASIVHPHIQFLGDNYIPTENNRILDVSRNHFRKKGENYWMKLIEEEEKLGERFIGRTGSIAWFSSFVPNGNNEVNGMVEDCKVLTDLKSSHILNLSNGILKILTAYNHIGVKSFNITTFSAPNGEDRKDFNLLFKIVSRPTPDGVYTSDMSGMEALQTERILEDYPEEVASKIRSYF